MTGQKAQIEIYDLFIIGGGVNGCGIARDAAGRGLKVGLAEMGDLAQATSSASTKLLHGGLRYLEYLEIRLVHEALKEREILLQAMPHIAWPMRFVLPYHKDMRFEGSSPVSRITGLLMPWTRGRRPAWMIRAGLFLYDHLGGRRILPATSVLRLPGTVEGRPLKDRFLKAWEYSDCAVEDARLVVLNARDAAEHGAEILVRTRVTTAKPEGGIWRVTLEDQESGKSREVHAKLLINAGGPWVGDIITHAVHTETQRHVRLVRGSHIVTRKLYDHDKSYFFQGEDRRIAFAIPFEEDFTLIGTTEADHGDPWAKPQCSADEVAYLCAFASKYFRKPVSPEDVVWSYSGVRPLLDDGQSAASAVTRDYSLELDRTGGAPLLNVFGGKITTYRRLAEAVLDRIAPFLPGLKGAWTKGVPLPGGDFPVDGLEVLSDELLRNYPFLTPAWARRLLRCYGTEARTVLGGAVSTADLGEDFGATLTERELRWMMTHEFARTAEDVVWRRTKLGLRMTKGQIARLALWMRENRLS
jgi:glycerol-3-phosphate dehydrogenase